MIFSSANWRTMSVIAFCSSVFSRNCEAATAMWERTPGSLASACAGGGEDTGADRADSARQRDAEPHDRQGDDQDRPLDRVALWPAHVPDDERGHERHQPELDGERP